MTNRHTSDTAAPQLPDDGPTALGQWRAGIAAMVAALFSFALDVGVEGMFVGGVLFYFLAIVGGFWTNSRLAVVFLLGLSSFLLIVGTAFKGPMPDIFFVNRGVLLFALFATAFVTVRTIDLQRRAAAAQRELTKISEDERDSMSGRIQTLEGRARAAAETVNVGVWEYYPDRDEIVVTRNFEEALGCGPDENIKTFEDWCRRIDPEGADIQRRLVKAFIAGQHSGSFTAEYFIDRPDGSRRYFVTRSAPLIDEDGKPYGLAGADSDVTELHALTEELRQARDAAEDANRSKSAFLANVSHELRTPLNAIIGFSDLMASEALGPIENKRYKGYVGDIRNAGGHLLELINDILDLSKVESGEVDFVRSDVNVENTVSHVLRYFQTQMDGSDVKAVASDIDQHLFVSSDERHFRQILMNLVSNAVKFSHGGDVVTVEATITEENTVRIVVKDDGIGVAASEMERVFRPFQQVAAAFTRNHEGTGLGLPIARALAELNGGSLHLESGPNTGTSAILTLPLAVPNRALLADH